MAFEDVVKETEKLALKACKEIDKNLDGEEATEKTKRAMGILSIYKGLIQASNNRYSLQYRVVKDLAENPQDLRKIIQVSLPHINPIKEIEKKK